MGLEGGLAFGEDLVRHFAGFAHERQLAGQQLVHHDTDGEDVGASIEGRARKALRGHVRDGADDASHLSQGDVELRLALGGDPEVEQLGVAVGLDHDVAGLDIAMDDIVLMRVREG